MTTLTPAAAAATTTTTTTTTAARTTTTTSIDEDRSVVGVEFLPAPVESKRTKEEEEVEKEKEEEEEEEEGDDASGWRPIRRDAVGRDGDQSAFQRQRCAAARQQNGGRGPAPTWHSPWNATRPWLSPSACKIRPLLGDWSIDDQSGAGSNPAKRRKTRENNPIDKNINTISSISSGEFKESPARIAMAIVEIIESRNRIEITNEEKSSKRVTSAVQFNRFKLITKRKTIQWNSIPSERWRFSRYSTKDDRIITNY